MPTSPPSVLSVPRQLRLKTPVLLYSHTWGASCGRPAAYAFCVTRSGSEQPQDPWGLQVPCLDLPSAPGSPSPLSESPSPCWSFTSPSLRRAPILPLTLAQALFPEGSWFPLKVANVNSYRGIILAPPPCDFQASPAASWAGPASSVGLT